MPPSNPNALATLFNLQRQSPRLDPSLRANGPDAAYQDMIPEEDLYGAQDQIAQGQEGRNYQYVPSREALRDQGLARLKQVFALEQEKQMPARIKAEGDLRQEQMRGQYGVEAARLQAERAAMERETGREFTAGQNDLNRTAMSDRLATTNTNTAARQAATQQNALTSQRIQRLATGKEAAPRPAGEGVLGRWLTGPSQTALNNAEIARLSQSQGPSSSPAGGVDTQLVSQVLDYLQSTPGMSLEQLVQGGHLDADPATLAAIQAQMGR